jgi:hypothetical protein
MLSSSRSLATEAATRTSSSMRSSLVQALADLVAALVLAGGFGAAVGLVCRTRRRRRDERLPLVPDRPLPHIRSCPVHRQQVGSGGSGKSGLETMAPGRCSGIRLSRLLNEARRNRLTIIVPDVALKESIKAYNSKKLEAALRTSLGDCGGAHPRGRFEHKGDRKSMILQARQ